MGRGYFKVECRKGMVRLGIIYKFIFMFRLLFIVWYGLVSNYNFLEGIINIVS